MANELSVTVIHSVTRDGVVARLEKSKTMDQAGTEYLNNTQSIATSSTAISMGDVTTLGRLTVLNTDDTNYVEVDSATTFDKFPQKIRPGEAIQLCPQTATLYAKANTAAVVIAILATEL